MAENDEFEQVIDAFEGDVPDEIVHIIQNEDEKIITPNPGGAQSRLADSDKDDLIIMVPPILSSNKDQERISISIDEIRRRVEAPEKLCATNLLSLLHLSKPRTPDLKETLSQYGLERISKRSACVSAFSKLSETESAHLAEDFSFLAARSLKTKEVGNAVAEQYGGWDQFKETATEIKDLLALVGQDAKTNDANMDLSTHGFSPLIINSVVDLITDILTQDTSKETQPV